jgi:hypothetical protein
MSFTTDELESFNAILEERLAAQGRELERIFDLRSQAMQQEFEQRLLAAQQEIVQALTAKIMDQRREFQTSLSQRLAEQQAGITQSVRQEIKQHQEQQHMQAQLEGIVDRALASQLRAIEELLNHRVTEQEEDQKVLAFANYGNAQQFDAIEVQTELPWDELSELLGKALDERFTILNEAAQSAINNWERMLSAQLQGFQMMKYQQPQTLTEPLSNTQAVFHSLEQLERLVESLQVTMTTNHALLSNRLMHHQQLSPEQAHLTNQDSHAEILQISEVHANGRGENMA